MTKRYTFTLVIEEGSDEFWESLKGKTGCDEVHEEIKSMLEGSGAYICEGEFKNCDLQLTKFENKP